MKTRRSDNIRGMSLAELTLCMTIIGVISAIAIPRYARATSRYRARSAAQRIAIDLTQAQSSARSSSSTRTVTFDDKTSSYQISGIASLDGGAAKPYVVSLADDPYNATIVSLDLATSPDVRFDGFGSPSCGGNITIKSGETVVVVSIDEASGRVTVK